MTTAWFWHDFLDWHIRTDHPWDMALTVEAWAGFTDEIARAIGEALLPAVQKAADAIREFGDTLARIEWSA